MASFNKVFLMGNLTRDPDLRVLPKGTAVCQFGLAVNREFKDESGNKKEEVTFLDVEAWGKQAETLAKYLVKGRSLFVEGRLKLESWEDKTTQAKRSRLKVVLEAFQFLGGKGDAVRGGEDAPPAGEGGKASAPPSPAGGAVGDEDVPF